MTVIKSLNLFDQPNRLCSKSSTRSHFVQLLNMSLFCTLYNFSSFKSTDTRVVYWSHCGLTLLSRGNINLFSLTTLLFTSFSNLFCKCYTRYSWQIAVIFNSFSESLLSKNALCLFLLNKYL